MAIVHAKVDQQLLLEKAKQAPDHQASTYGKHELHTWLHAKGSKHERSMTGTFLQARRPDLRRLGRRSEAALDVLDGKKPSLADKDSPLAAAIPPGTSFVAGRRNWPTPNCPASRPWPNKSSRSLWRSARTRRKSFFDGQADREAGRTLPSN